MSDQESDDVELIRRTLYKFSQALDARRFDDWVQLFTEDGEFAGRTGVRRGRQEILANINDGELARDPHLCRMHTIHNPLIDIAQDGQSATSFCYLVQFDQRATGPVEIRLATYTDRLVKQDGRWLFSSRTIAPYRASGPGRHAGWLMPVSTAIRSHVNAARPGREL
jgi:hypothetical protein